MKTIIGTGVIFSFISVVMSALGSHALRQILVSNDSIENYNLANQFMMYHGLALILLGVLYHIFPEIKFNYVAWAFIAGSVMFQGILYVKSLYPYFRLGILNPIGGSVLMIAWIYLAYLVIRFIK